MAAIDYGVLIYKNGKRIIPDDKRYFYHKKEKRYIGVTCKEDTQYEMFDNFVKQNNNIDLPESCFTVIPMGNTCLAFYKNLDPMYYVNGQKKVLFKQKDSEYDLYAVGKENGIVLDSLFDEELDGEIRGYQFSYGSNKYAVIYGYLLEEYDRPNFIKFLDKSLVLSETGVYHIQLTTCNDYQLLLDHIVRKDYRRNARRRIWREVKEIFKKKSFEDLKNAIDYWWLLH